MSKTFASGFLKALFCSGPLLKKVLKSAGETMWKHCIKCFRAFAANESVCSFTLLSFDLFVVFPFAAVNPSLTLNMFRYILVLAPTQKCSSGSLTLHCQRGVKKTQRFPQQTFLHHILPLVCTEYAFPYTHSLCYISSCASASRAESLLLWSPNCLDILLNTSGVHVWKQLTF